MKKDQLLNLLNQSADSISLHDGDLLSFDLQNGRVILVVCIGEYHYCVNSLTDYVSNVKNEVVLTLQFDGVKNVVQDGDDDFETTNCEILDNIEKDGVYTLNLCNFSQYKTFSFAFETFAWTDAQELTKKQLKTWRLSNQKG